MRYRCVVWLNGCPGAGKTSVAQQLCNIDGCYLDLDAEALGRLIQRLAPGLRDYQTSAVWCWAVRSWCRWAASADHIPVVHMSLMETRPRREVIDHLRRNGIEVIEVLLSASASELRRRIVERGGSGTPWCLRELPRFYELSGRLCTTIRLDSEGVSAQNLSAFVHAHVCARRGSDPRRHGHQRWYDRTLLGHKLHLRTRQLVPSSAPKPPKRHSQFDHP